MARSTTKLPYNKAANISSSSGKLKQGENMKINIIKEAVIKGGMNRKTTRNKTKVKTVSSDLGLLFSLKLRSWHFYPLIGMKLPFTMNVSSNKLENWLESRKYKCVSFVHSTYHMSDVNTRLCSEGPDCVYYGRIFHWSLLEIDPPMMENKGYWMLLFLVQDKENISLIYLQLSGLCDLVDAATNKGARQIIDTLESTATNAKTLTNKFAQIIDDQKLILQQFLSMKYGKY